MPRPPAPPDKANHQELLDYLILVVREECSTAATRHDDVLARLSQQEKSFDDKLSQVRDIPQTVIVNALPPLEDRQPLLSDSPPLLKTPPPEEYSTKAPNASIEVAAGPVCTANSNGSASSGKPVQTRLSVKSKLNFGQDSKHEEIGVKKKSVLVRIVTHENFEAFVAAVIVSSTVVMCFEVQYKGLQVGFDLKYKGHTLQSHEIWPAAEWTFWFFDWFFGLVFLVEAIMKLACMWRHYFHDVWNCLDLFVVITFLVDKGASKFLPINKQLLQLLRLFRLVRLFRLLETLEGLDALYIMTTAIKGMKRVLMWAVVLLLVMLTTVALFLSQILHAYYFKEISSNPEKQQKLYEYFGSFTRCLLSMFELTLANWPPVTRLLAEEVTEWFMLICVIHKLTIGFAVIGVINGVIMQETFQVAATDDMLMVRRKQRSAELLRTKMNHLFEALDNSADGSLGYDEFQIIGHVPEVKTWLASMDIETDDLPSLFELIDVDNSGTIPVEELVTRIPRIKGAARSLDLLALAKHIQTGNFSPAHTTSRQENHKELDSV